MILKVDPFQYSSLNELADRAEKKAKAMEAANSAAPVLLRDRCLSHWTA